MASVSAVLPTSLHVHSREGKGLLRRLIKRSFDISFQNKILWTFGLIPTFFLILCISIFFFAFYTPLVGIYSLFAYADAASEAELFHMMQDTVIEGIMFLAPLLVVFLAIAIFSKNAIIKSIQVILGGKQVDVRTAWDASRGYFGPTLILVLTIAAVSLAVHLIEVFVIHLGAHTNTFAVVSLILEVLIVLGSLFSLHYVLIHNDPVLKSLRESFHLTTAHFVQLLSFFLFLLATAIVLVCLMGAVVGISYYTSIVVGLLVGMLLLVVLIPVNIFLTTLWTLFYMSLADLDTHTH